MRFNLGTNLLAGAALLYTAVVGLIISKSRMHRMAEEDLLNL